MGVKVGVGVIEGVKDVVGVKVGRRVRLAVGVGVILGVNGMVAGIIALSCFADVGVGSGAKTRGYAPRITSKPRIMMIKIPRLVNIKRF